MEILFNSVFILALAAVLVYASHLLRIPAAVGLLAAGILAGPHGLGLIHDPHNVEVLAEIGVILLLFSIGMEFSLRDLIAMKRAALGGGALQVGLTLASFWAVARFSDLLAGDPVFIGCLAALSSTAVVLNLLQARADTETPHGRASIGMLIFQDLAVVPMMLLAPILAGGGQGLAGELGITALKATAIIGGLALAARYLIPHMLRLILATRNRELFLLATLTGCFLVAWLTAQAGLSLALGAFLAGMVIADSEYAHQAFANIAPLRDVFTSFFFISIGMLFDLGFLTANPGLVAVSTLVVVAAKAAIVIGVILALGLPLRIAMISGLTLAQVGEFSFVLSRVGLEHGLLPEATWQLFLAVAVLSMIATPFLMAAAPRLADAALRLPLPNALRQGFSQPFMHRLQVSREELGNHLLIIGFGLAGRKLAQAARLWNIPYVILEMNPDTVRRERDKGEPILYGDAMFEPILESAGASRARIVSLVMSDPAAARRVTSQLRRLNPSAEIIVRTRFMSEREPLLRIGADEVIPEEFETTMEILSRVLARYFVPTEDIQAFIQRARESGYEMSRSPATAPLSFCSLRSPEMMIRAMRVETNSPLDGSSIRKLQLRQRYGVTVLALRRGGEQLTNPDPDHTIRAGEVAVTLGSARDLERAAALFSNKETSA